MGTVAVLPATDAQNASVHAGLRSVVNEMAELNGFREMGAGALGFALKDSCIESLDTELGLRAAYGFRQSGARYGRAWLRELDVGTDSFSGHFLGAPDMRFALSRKRGGDHGYALASASRRPVRDAPQRVGSR